MNKKFYIQNSVKLRGNKFYRNNEVVLDFPSDMKLGIFLKQAYKALKMEYPKFHKMDALCKLGILAAELLLERSVISPDTALIFSNKASSLETDEDFRRSMNHFPSPSAFVYTLPNIVLGELSIRYKLRSENAFFVSDNFDPELMKDYCESLLLNTESPEVLCAWIDLRNEEYDVFLCHISENGSQTFSEENLRKLYLRENG